MSEQATTTVRESGLTVEEAKAVLDSKFKTIVPSNDPVLMCVELQRLMIEDQANEFIKHEKRLSDLINEAAAQCVHSVNESLSTLKDEALQGSIKNTLAAASEKARETERSNGALLDKLASYRKTLAIFTALNWVAVAALYFIMK